MTVYNYRDKRGIFDLYLSISYYIYVVLKKILFSLILIFSFGCLIGLRNNSALESSIRNKVLFVTYPYFAVKNVFEYMFDSINNYLIHIKDINVINNNLVKQNFNLQSQLFDAKVLERDNNELKKILNLVSTKNKTSYTVAKINIISDSGFVNKIEIKSNEFIRDNDLVLDGDANLIGKVINSNENTAEILLVNDSNFKIGAILEESMNKVIVSGNGTRFLDVSYFFGKEFNVVDGEKVITSNDGNVNQSGINIGTVRKNKNGGFSVELASNISRINYAVVLHKTEYVENDSDAKIYNLLKKNEDFVIKNNDKYKTVIDKNMKFEDI